MSEVKRTERGWGGHFIGSPNCLFKRNTLLEFEDLKIVISTVGSMFSKGEEGMQEIGYNRYYETMAFHASKQGFYWDADVSREIYVSDLGLPCGIYDDYHKGSDQEANDIHENIVSAVTEVLSGENKKYIQFKNKNLINLQELNDSQGVAT